MAAYSPPFTLTHAMLSRVAEIAELVGQWRFAQSSQVPMLRRENRIRTIQASLAIEHNTLSVEQVTAVIEGKTVLGLPREIQEVRNAFAAYEAMPDWDPSGNFSGNFPWQLGVEGAQRFEFGQSPLIFPPIDYPWH